jgi:two-component system, NtrC family, nitrogen regulation sensor histidine kinase NtrY
VLDHRFAGGEGRWQVSAQFYRHHGLPARIVFVADIRQVLADEEIRVWQRLIRVISHEVNNSLAPIASLCQTLDGILLRSQEQAHVPVVREGLSLIAERASGLKDFISIYSRIARLPEARKALFPVRRLIERVMGMFAADGVVLEEGLPDFALYGDQIHLEQVLINLLRNAVQANQDAATPVTLRVSLRHGDCVFEIADRGAGIANPENLFVPFYTTKPDGAGIGLVLCRNIIAKHGGKVSLANREDGRGAIARVSLPLPPE